MDNQRSSSPNQSSFGEDVYRPRAKVLMPTLISQMNTSLNISGSSSSQSPSPSPYTSPISSPALLMNQPPSLSTSVLAAEKKEDFNPDDEQPAKGKNNAYDLLVQQTGSGSAFNLRQVASIRRLLPNCQVYTDILEYINKSNGGKMITVKTIYKIHRYSDSGNQMNESFRLLLWHGTSPTCIPGIIETGFRKGKGGMFGGGVYFADRIAKSLVYTTKNKASDSAFFVLSEVYPGKMYKSHHFHTNYKKAPKGFDSVKGNGAEIPYWRENRDYFGAIMPCGETRANPRHPSYDMKYNEYIVYNMDRVIVRFIVECTF